MLWKQESHPSSLANRYSSLLPTLSYTRFDIREEIGLEWKNSMLSTCTELERNMHGRLQVKLELEMIRAFKSASWYFLKPAN